MALKVILTKPWYDPDGYYRRVEDNPHSVNLDLSVVPSTAEIEDTTGKKEKVWKLRGETDPALRAQVESEEAEARKVLPLAKALHNPPPASPADNKRIEELEAQLKATNDALAAIQAQLAKAAEPAKEPEKAPETPAATVKK